MSDERFESLCPTDAEVARVQQPIPDATRRQAAAWTAPSDEEVARLQARLKPIRSVPSPPPRWPILVAALALLGLRTVPLPTPQDLHTPPPIAADTTVRLPRGQLHLNQDISAEGSGALSVLSRSAAGARVSVTTGSVTFEVDPNGSARDLRVQSGPIEVRVTGTRFTVARLPETGAVHVSVERGSVDVLSPEGTLALSAGEAWAWIPALTLEPPPPEPVPAAAPPPAPETDAARQALEESTRLFVSIQDAVDEGLPADEALKLTETFLAVYPDSLFREEVEAMQLHAMAELLPPEEAISEVKLWLSGNQVSPRRAELLLLAGRLQQEVQGDCSLSMGHYNEVIEIGSLALRQLAREQLQACRVR